MSEPLLIAKSAADLYLPPNMANRHGLVAGATGTGKTVTPQVMAQAFSRMKSAAPAMGSSVGRQIVRGVRGSILGGSRR